LKYVGKDATEGSPSRETGPPRQFR
jgi:hypothetical protein